MRAVLFLRPKVRYDEPAHATASRQDGKMPIGPGILTVAIVVGSAFIYTPGIGMGGWLMATVPLSPIIYLVLRLIFRLQNGR
jgi:hypothetical protein